jgi:hypothetical protein
MLIIAAKVQIIMEFCVILPQKLNQRKKKLMNRTIIFILIGLLCMPCMAVAETSKELEEAIDKCKQECSALFDSNDTVAYPQAVHKLMDLCLKADRLLDALRQTQFENPQQVIESLKQEVEVFRNGAEPNDDLTMMCLYVS